MSIIRRVLFVYTLSVYLFACVGPMGPPGAEGATGEQGPAGAPGSALVSTTSCSGNRITTAAGYVVKPSHTLYRFSDGSVLATCAIDDLYTETTGVAMYRASQAASLTGSCTVQYDVGTNGIYGHWTFTRAGDVASVVYSDPADMGSGPSGFFLTCQEL